MNAKRWSFIGLLVMALQAGLTLPVMADTKMPAATSDQLKAEGASATAICYHFDELMALPEPLRSVISCNFYYLAELSPETRQLLFDELIDAFEQSTKEASTDGAKLSGAQAPPTRQNYGGGVEQWRSTVARYFAAGDVDHALSVIDCESIGGNPRAINSSSGASGLFQHMPKYWAERSSAAGWSGSDIFDPEANIAVAAWLVYSDGWYHWPNCG